MENGNSSKNSSNENQQNDSVIPATFNEKIITVFCLFLVTIIVLYFGDQTLRLYDASLTTEYKIQWKVGPEVKMEPGPASFLVNWDQSELIHRGPINDSLKEELIALLNVEGIPVQQAEAIKASYFRAIDTLAYNSNVNAYSVLILLLILAGLGGVVGVQIRSISNFVGVTCFKNDLDIKRWWPWYVLRPLLGFLFGILVVVLVKAKLFLGTDTQVGDESLWWLGLAILTGFGASDFGDRLRLLTQTLFGKNK